ncbi:MAG: CD1871A family CXXC motif-containing protein [Lachnospiraceae bacterium]|nr:CD1871A family CXXC motif-containing protein [Lachnospiraceae bacterium]
MNNRTKNFARIIVILLSVIFIYYGAARGEGKVVLDKAVNICLECIGLG